MLAKMKRRGLALFVAMVMVLGMLPTAALADELGGGEPAPEIVSVNIDPDSEQGNVPADPDGEQGNVPADPDGEQGNVPADPDGDQGNVPADPDGEQGTVPADPDGEQGNVPADPDGEQGNVPADPDGEQGNVPADPDGEQGNVPADPDGEQGVEPVNEVQTLMSKNKGQCIEKYHFYDLTELKEYCLAEAEKNPADADDYSIEGIVITDENGYKTDSGFQGWWDDYYTVSAYTGEWYLGHYIQPNDIETIEVSMKKGVWPFSEYVSATLSYSVFQNISDEQHHNRCCVDLGIEYNASEDPGGEQKAWFFIRSDGMIPFEDGKGYLANQYEPTHPDNGESSDGMLEGTLYQAEPVYVKYNGPATGVTPSNLSMFDAVKNAIKTAPTDAAIKEAVSSYNPDTQMVLWYVVKAHNDNGQGGCPNWHVDGVICDKDAVYVGLTYDANLPQGVTTEVEVPASVLCPSGTEFTVGAPNPTVIDGYTFAGWEDQDGNEYQPNGNIKVEKNTTLYARWTPDKSQTGTLTVNKIVEGGAALPSDFKILVKSNGNTVYTLGLTASEGVIGPDADTNYTWTISNVTPGIYSIDEENALVDEYDLTSNANPAMVSVTAGNMSAVNVTNKYEDASDETASFTIKKVDEETGAALAGAVFHICADVNCDGTCDDGQTVTTAAGGLATISGLKSGTTYYLRETKAPEGYKLGDTVYKITVDGSHEEQAAGGNIFAYLWKLVASMFVGTEDNAASVVKDQQGNFLIPNEKFSGTLEITKTFSGIDALPWQFHMLVKNADDGELCRTLYVADAATAGNGSYTWTLGLDEGYYVVEETGYARAGYDVTVDVGDKTDVTEPRTTVVVMEDVTTRVSFVNTYTANTPTPISPVDITFTGMKYVDGQRNDVPEFYFYLKKIDTEGKTVDTQDRGHCGRGEELQPQPGSRRYGDQQRAWPDHLPCAGV